MDDRPIIVASMSNPGSILAAFQRAMDAVVCPEAVKELFDGRDAQHYSHVYSGKGRPVLGRARLLFSRQHDTFWVSLIIFAPSAPSTSEQYVPESVARRMAIAYGKVRAQVRLEESPGGQREYVAALPIQAARLQARPQVFVGMM